MELLSEVTINSTLHRVSDAWQDLTHLWEPKIASWTPTKFGTAELYGGYARPKWGSRSFLPDLFADDWPPPATLEVKDMLTDSTEALAVTVFEGTLHLVGYDEAEVNYTSYGAEYTTTISGGSAWSGTLQAIFLFWCSASYLNLTLDASKSRPASPAVDYTPAEDEVLISALSDVAAFFSHAFYIEDGTLHLIDLLLDNGTDMDLDEFGYFRGSNYSAPEPVSLFKAGDRDISGSYAYGEEFNVSPVCHTSSGNIDTALGDIKTIVEYDRYVFKVVPEASMMPVIGQKINVTNESLQDSTTTWLRVTDISPDITKSEIRIEGFGVST